MLTIFPFGWTWASVISHRQGTCSSMTLNTQTSQNEPFQIAKPKTIELQAWLGSTVALNMNWAHSSSRYTLEISKNSLGTFHTMVPDWSYKQNKTKQNKNPCVFQSSWVTGPNFGPSTCGIAFSLPIPSQGTLKEHMLFSLNRFVKTHKVSTFFPHRILACSSLSRRY